MTSAIKSLVLQLYDPGLSNLTVGFGVTMALSGTEAGVGTTKVVDGFLKGIITGVTTDSTNSASSIVVKVVSRVSGAGTETAIDYVQSDPLRSFQPGSTIIPVNNSGINTGKGIGSICRCCRYCN